MLYLRLLSFCVHFGQVGETWKGARPRTDISHWLDGRPKRGRPIKRIKRARQSNHINLLDEIGLRRCRTRSPEFPSMLLLFRCPFFRCSHGAARTGPTSTSTTSDLANSITELRLTFITIIWKMFQVQVQTIGLCDQLKRPLPSHPIHPQLNHLIHEHTYTHATTPKPAPPSQNCHVLHLPPVGRGSWNF